MTAAQPERDVIAEANRIRLDENLTYERLAQLVGLTTKTLHRALTDRSVKPYDRTLHRISEWLDRRQQTPPATRRSTRQQAQA
jgi:transcriptional regulator with XRE-family HTH domain